MKFLLALAIAAVLAAPVVLELTGIMETFWLQLVLPAVLLIGMVGWVARNATRDD